MSVRYTAVEGMGESPVREFDRTAGKWQDRVELRLDNRQVFFLFFGSAVVACMLFVLGVMVGKRIESRGQADAAPLADPLAALDRARQPPPGVAAPAELSFPSRLIKTAAPAAKLPKPTPIKLAKAAPPVVKPAPTVKPALAASPLAVKPPQAASPPAVKPPAATSPPAVKPPAAASPPAVKPPLAASPPAVKPALAASPPAASPVAADAAKSRGKFTLQLSTFATADDAAVFAQNYPGAFVISGEVPGKGTAYRVRYGNFASYKDATAAKETFEKQHNMIALIAAR